MNDYVRKIALGQSSCLGKTSGIVLTFAVGEKRDGSLVTASTSFMAHFRTPFLFNSRVTAVTVEMAS
jgi:hypothetical protein